MIGKQSRNEKKNRREKKKAHRNHSQSQNVTNEDKNAGFTFPTKGFGPD